MPNYSITGHPDRPRLWIAARTPGISGERFATALIADLSARDGITLKFSLWPVAGQDVVIRKTKPRTDIATGEVLDDVIPY